MMVGVEAEGWDVPSDERRVEVCWGGGSGELEQLAYRTFWEAVPTCIHEKVVKGDRHPERFARERRKPTGACKEYDRSSLDTVQELAEGRFVNHKISVKEAYTHRNSLYLPMS